MKRKERTVGDDEDWDTDIVGDKGYRLECREKGVVSLAAISGNQRTPVRTPLIQ